MDIKETIMKPARKIKLHVHAIGIEDANPELFFLHSHQNKCLRKKCDTFLLVILLSIQEIQQHQIYH